MKEERPSFLKKRSKKLLSLESATAVKKFFASFFQKRSACLTLSICADPSNLPYSNDKLAGFENKIAAIIAADMNTTPTYTWNEQRRSFFRRTLFANRCDVVISAPAGLPRMAFTKPWFTSTYVAVTRANSPPWTSFDDPKLPSARIGLQLLGSEGSNTPPAMSLASRGITDHITGFPMWADDNVPNPQGRIVDAVASNQIDVALVWGPFGGYFAQPHGAALRVQPITADPKLPEQTYIYPMSMAVRKADTALRDRLQQAIDRHRPEIAAVLATYAIPLAP